MQHLWLRWMTAVVGGDWDSQTEHIYPSISSRGATGADAAERRASHMRARRLGKGGARAPTFLLHPRLHDNKFKKQNKKKQSHATVNPPPFNRAWVRLISAVIRSQTAETVARRVARVPSDQFFLTNAAVIEDRARQNWPEPYIVSHEPLLWHPTTRQMAFTPPTPPTSRKTRPALLPDAAVKSRSLFRTWPPIAAVLSNCLDGCLFSQATTASSGFFLFFFFTWEFLTTSGPMLGYRPNHRAAEPLI